MFKVISPFGETQHPKAESAEAAVLEHKAMKGLDGINAHDDKIKAEKVKEPQKDK